MRRTLGFSTSMAITNGSARSSRSLSRSAKAKAYAPPREKAGPM
jgi:hypothetical protein